MTNLIEALCREAKKLGASEAVRIVVTDIVVDDRTTLKCQVPLCPHYRTDLMCPPNVMPAVRFKQVLGSYHEALLIKVNVPGGEKRSESGSLRPEYMDSAKNASLRLHEIVCQLETQCLESGNFFASGFIGGACPLCSKCVGVKSGLPCRHPFKARPSMEAMGIDVMSTAEKAGLKLSFNKNSARSWIGLLLID